MLIKFAFTMLSPGGNSTAERTLKCLIAEDDYISGVILSKLVQKWGSICLVRNGKQAVETVSLALENHEPFDLICLDVMMPEMDGNESLRKIRTLEAAAGITGASRAKIIMTSASDSSETVMAAIQGQCDHFLCKPIRKEKLEEVLRSLALII
jgi:two-component system chemotaxis response regulator CheY